MGFFGKIFHRKDDQPVASEAADLGAFWIAPPTGKKELTPGSRIAELVPNEAPSAVDTVPEQTVAQKIQRVNELREIIRERESQEQDAHAGKERRRSEFASPYGEEFERRTYLPSLEVQQLIREELRLSEDPEVIAAENQARLNTRHFEADIKASKEGRPTSAGFNAAAKNFSRKVLGEFRGEKLEQADPNTGESGWMTQLKTGINEPRVATSSREADAPIDPAAEFRKLKEQYVRSREQQVPTKQGASTSVGASASAARSRLQSL